MKQRFDKLVATVLAFLILVLPGVLSARERRGANLVIIFKDGHYVAGELIAVKLNSLLLLSAAGRDETVELADIETVRIARKSRAGKGAFLGSMGGVLTGGILGGASGGVDEFTSGQAAVVFGFLFGIVGGLGGLILGAIAGTDKTVRLEGMSEPALRTFLAELSRKARIQDFR